MIKFTDLTFRYSLRSQAVFEDVNFEIIPGTLTLVTGASGSGKSTLLRCINGLVPHFSGGIIAGKIQVFGSDPIAEGVEVMAHKVGFVFQEPESQFVFDVIEDEIAFSLENAGVPRQEMERRIQEVLQMVRLSPLRKKNLSEISGGEQQKVAIASALVTQPLVLILDEPTSQLDPISADEVLKFVIELKNHLNLTVLISEHRLERLLPYTDMILNLNAERRAIIGKPQEILPLMDQVPPIVEIAQRLKFSPLPLTPATFPQVRLAHKPINQIEKHCKPQDSQPACLEIDGLSARLNDQLILNDVSFNLHRGEILVLMGPNGAGKTTLLRSVLKMIPHSGKVTLMGADTDNLQFAEIIQEIAYLPQNPNDLLFAESVIDELKITLKNHGKDAEGLDFYVFLKSFDLGHLGDQYPRDLSVGERQRTALAAVTVHDPRIIFLDEPTRGMDYDAKKRLNFLFHHWRQLGKAILLVTHDVEFAARLADRVVILENGNLMFCGAPRTAFTEFPAYQTQTARVFTDTGWITPDDIPPDLDLQ
ncbi:MAG: ABC transporter ATP-binding protein [Brevefilum fermentans]|jgi:energy-coupling factor transport system ATP-binding protein|uniref:Putative ABC transporter ATP-binding protein n=1 Tax=Candidatus Brevifilum fermentans TaxID=1986204 RepID=A0A1Y6K3W0_9CHLR|nr:ABC transporter ATP-binding protein [Brevefilum fermentans]SMX54304.1 putative ABC transporter ATP-binding protein [Brevefilum fermentans]